MKYKWNTFELIPVQLHTRIANVPYEIRAGYEPNYEALGGKTWNVQAAFLAFRTLAQKSLCNS